MTDGLGVNDHASDNANDTTRLNNIDWRENLTKVAPEYVSEWDEFKNADSPEKFFDQLKNHRSMIGQSIRIPSGEAGEDQMSEFYNKIQNKVDGLMRTPDIDDDESVKGVLKKLGLPEDTDGYKLGDDVGIDDETLGAYRAMALESGLTKKQFEGFINKLGERDKQSSQQKTELAQKDKDGLKGEWGDAYPQRAKIAANVAEKTGAPPALVESIASGNVDSATMKWLHSLGTQFGSESNNFNDNQSPVDTPADIQGQIDDVMNNDSHPYWDTTHPAHSRAVDKMMTLRRKLAG